MKVLFEYSDILNRPFEAFKLNHKNYNFPVEAHWHYFVEFIYIENGEIVIHCNGKKYRLTKGQAFIFPPQAVHSIHDVSADEDLEILGLKFDVNKLSIQDSYIPDFHVLFMKSLYMDDLPLCFQDEAFKDFPLKKVFDDCMRELEMRAYGYDYYVQCKLSILLLECIRIWRRDGFFLEDSIVPGEERFNIYNTLEYIDKHSHENIKVETLAAKCNMSYSYFAKTFHKLYGQSCKSYIEFIRLSKVENYLLFTDYDLNYISNECGFSDCSHLIRVFKKKYGTTPKQYRMQHRM